ncbi:MAG: DUF262 domain-containing protein [Caldilineaceae bacterium]|nr:DUF262 domain-containing protein [Caldilineaceae bacterium]
MTTTLAATAGEQQLGSPSHSQLTLRDIDDALDERAGVEHESEHVGESHDIEPFDPTLIVIDPREPSVDIVLRRIEEGAINLQPDFQRMGGIWDEGAQSRLIESMLLRIPLPAFYLDASDENEWLVIDGHQRLTAIYKFMCLRELKLSKLEFWHDYNRRTYDDLPRPLQRRLEDTQLTFFLVRKGTPDRVKFNIFKRINTGGVALSRQEIRHALNQGHSTELLRELANSEEFQTAVDSSVKPIRMTDRECVLRYLAFKLRSPSEYSSRDDLDSFLSEQMQKINQRGEEDPNFLEDLRDDFKRTMRVATRIFGDWAFRKYIPDSKRRPQVSKALFEAWSVNLDSLSEKDVKTLCERKDVLMGKFSSLMTDDEFMKAISYGTDHPRRVHCRFNSVKEIVLETLGG